MFHKLCRITRSSRAQRTESVSAIGHELLAAMSSLSHSLTLLILLTETIVNSNTVNNYEWKRTTRHLVH